MSLSSSKPLSVSLTTLIVLLGSCSATEEKISKPASGSERTEVQKPVENKPTENKPAKNEPDENKPADEPTADKEALGAKLYECAAANLYKETRAAIEAGANVNFQGSRNKTPLMITESLEITQLLLDHGADPKLKSNEWFNRDVLYYKVTGESYEAFALVLEKCQKDQIENAALAPDGVFGPPLIHAIARENNPELYVEALLKKGANVNWVSNDSVYGERDSKYTPLILAAKRGNLSVVKLLLQYHADVKAENRYDDNAEDVAATEEIRSLLREAASAPAEAGR